MSYLWRRSGTPTFSSNGQFASGASAFFYAGGTSSPLEVFQEAGFVRAWPVPVVADINGVFPGIYIPYGSFRERVLDQNGVLLSDLDLIDNIAPPTSGGGIVVTQDMVLGTGDIKWRPATGVLASFVRMNANTIGSAISSASELANSSTQNLFLYLWSNFSDAVAPVSGGRGASPAADFTANKTIGIPSMRGLVMGGLDDMGATAAGILQAVTTCTINGTTTIVVVSAAGIAVGDSAIVNGVSIGPIVSIAGTTIVTTSLAAGSASGISFRSSRFADAQIAANVAGVQNYKQTINQMPAHSHLNSLADPSHSHGGVVTGQSQQFNYTQSSGGTAVFSVLFGNTSFAVTGMSINNATTGGGNPQSILQPTITGTFYMHL